MVKKFDVITKLYEEATQEVTESPEKWIAFLQSASKNYRLPFDEQLLIHVQRPEATAVLPMEKWNEKFGRWVKRDSKGIAVFDKSSDRLKLKYYFDVSDTREGKYKRLVRPVSLWSVAEEQQEPVKEALVNTFGVTDGDRKEFAMVILEASLNIAEDNIGDYLPDILLATKDSPLEEIDEFNIRLKMKQLLANSISYMLFLRCGIEPDIYLETRDFQNIRDFHTKELVNLFGVTASDMSEMALGEVADTIRKLKIQERKQRTFVEQKTTDYNVDNKQKIATERGQDNGSNHIQQTGRLSPAESYNSRGRGSSPWEVRISPKTISDEESVRNVSESSDSGNIEPASDSDGGRSTEQNGDTYSADGRERGRDRRTESQRSDGVDRENEQYPAESAGNREERNPGELEENNRSSDILPSEEEQLQILEEKAEEKSPAFSFSQELIDEVLQDGPHFADGKYDICYVDFPVDSGEGKATLEVRNQHLSIWNIDAKKIFQQARSNTQPVNTPILQSMDEMMLSIFNEEGHSTNLLNESVEFGLRSHDMLYALTNMEKQYGASMITQPEVLNKLEQLFPEGFYVLPSSVHEVLIVPDNGEVEPRRLGEMVRAVNWAEVKREEVLSDRVYSYDKEKHQIRQEPDSIQKAKEMER